MNVYPFIEAEKAQQRNVKRACELLKVSRAAYYAARGGQPSGRDRAGRRADRADHGRAQAVEGPVRRAADPRGAAPPGPPAFPQAGRPADAPGRAGRAGAEAVEEDHDPGPGGRGPGRCDPPGLHRRRLQGSTSGGAATSPTSPPGKAGSTSPPSSTSPPAASSGSPWPITCAPSWSPDALANAVAARDPAPGVIFHSDRGCQYTSAAYAALAGDCQVTLSVGPQGPVLGQRRGGELLRLAQGRAHRHPGLADPGCGLPGGRGVHRLVQRHPAAQHPGLPQPRRLRKRPPRKAQAM